MAIRTYKVTLDSKNVIAPEPVYLRQGDKTGSVVIDATLMDNGSPVSLIGLTPMFKANTADGQAVIADSTGFNIVNASGGEFTYQVPNALSSVAGKIKTAYFSLSDASGSESTFNVPFVVSAAVDITQEQAQDYITIIDGTINSLRKKMDSLQIDFNTIINNYSKGDFYNKFETDSKDSATLDSAKWFASSGDSSTLSASKTYTDNSISGVVSIPEAFANLAAIQAKYPNGANGIMVAADNGHKYLWANGTWTDAGVYQSAGIADEQKDIIRQYILNSDNLIKNGEFFNGDMSSLGHNTGVSLAPQNFDSMDWAHVIGNINQGNTDTYFNIPVSGATSWIPFAQLKFTCDINTSKISNLKVFIDLNFTAGSSRTVLINQLTLQINKHNNISVLTPNIYSLNPDNKTITSINIGIASIDDAVDYSIGKAKINRYQQPVNGSDYVNNYKINQKDNLVEDSQLLTGQPYMRATNGTISLANINGHNWNQMATVDATKSPEAYYTIDKRALPYPLSNFINRKWLFKGTLLCNTDSDYMLYCDAYDQTDVMHRITIGSVHVYANKEQAFAFETPTMSESGIFAGTDVTIVNFTIMGSDPTVTTNITDVFIKPFAPEQKKTTLDYFEKDAIAKYGTSLVGHDGSVRTEIHQFSGLDWIYSVPTPPSNNETYLRVPNPNNIHALEGYYYSNIRLGLSIVSEAAENFTLRLDIVDKTGKITSKDLGVYYVMKNPRKDIKVDTPRIGEIYTGGQANIAEIRFVISPENKTANYNTGNYSINLPEEKVPQTDSMFLPNYISYSLGHWFNGGAGITKTDILENNIRKVSIKGVSGKTNTDLYVSPVMLPAYQQKRWQEHLVFEPDIDCTVKTRFDEFNGNNLVKRIVIGSHKVLAGQKVLLNDVSPKLSDFVISPNDTLNFVIETDMPNDKLSYKISEFYIKEYIPETLSSPSQSTSCSSKLPELRFYGQVPQTATDKTTVNFKFVSGSLTNAGYTTLAWQGQSSKSLAKKSYKLKTYTDSGLSKKLKMQIDPTFASTSKFTLKAFYSDKTFSLDNIANEVIHDMVITRHTISEHLSKSDYLGQNKGRPVMVYVNDIFAGLYFMRSGSKEETYGMSEDDPNQFVVEGETESGAAMFQAPHVTKWGDGTGADLNLEFSPTIPDKLSDEQKKAFDDFVNMVFTGDLSTFKSSLTPEALHSAIDYIIFYNLFGNVDSCGRNLEWATWDGGKHFMVIPYDFDQSMFNAYDGLTVGDVTADGFPVKQMRFGTTTNKYFDLIAKAYPDEIKTRYAELRSGLLREDNVLSRYTNFMKQIDVENYAKELELWPRKTVIDYKYISNFINTRFKLVDTQFAAFIAPLLARK